jgi:hypothetical protein
VQATETRVHQLETQVEALRASPHAVTMPEVRALDDEIRAQRPEVTAVTLAQGFQLAVPGEPARPVMLVVVSTSRPLRTADRAALQRWLAVRTGQPELRLIEQPAPRAKKPAAR